MILTRAQRLIAAFIVALGLQLAPAHADQGTACTPTTGTISGLQYAQAVNDALDALITSNSGASAPANSCDSVAELGQLWLDTTADPAIWKLYDGTVWDVIGYMDQAAAVWSPPVGGGGDTLASAATTDLWSKHESYLSITGTTGITSFSTGLAELGTVKFITFTGALTITNNATSLILPNGGSNVTTAAGDRAMVVSTGGSNVMVLAYTRADGTSLNTSSAFSANLIFSAVITPTTIAGNTDNWAPTGLSTAAIIRAAGSSSFNITGLTAQTSGTMLWLQNISSSTTLTLVHESASSTAANRFNLGVDYALGPLASIQLRYDGTFSRWVAVGSYRLEASSSQATTGTDSTTVMTPRRVNTAIQTGYRYLTSQLFTASGSYTPTTGTRLIHVWGCGGGGGGGGANGSDADSAAAGGGGGGGEGGEYYILVSSLTPPVTVTIGAAGSAGGAGSSGSDGTATTFGSTSSFSGGSGGHGESTSLYSGASGGAGGTAGTVPALGFLGSGQGGGYGFAADGGGSSENDAAGGQGGNSICGGGALGNYGDQVGDAATGYGGGGAGGSQTNSGGSAGGAGKAGILVIEEFN